MVEYVNVKMSPEAKQVIAKKADKANLPLAEFALQCIVKHLGCPEDFAIVPRNKMGRPRKDQRRA